MERYSALHWRYDAENHQAVAFSTAAEGEGMVEVLRLDADEWEASDRGRMRHRRDPNDPTPRPARLAVADAVDTLILDALTGGV